MNEQVRELVNRVVALLVAGRYADLEALTHGVRLGAEEMAAAVRDYGRKLELPPADGLEIMDVVEVKSARPRRWSVAMPLWTQEEGRSDLTVEMTLVEQHDGVVVELDGIHVL